MTLKFGRRTRAILDAIAAAGASGHTRHELAERLKLPLSSVCSCANRLLELRLIQVAEHERMSPYGHMVEVLVARQITGGSLEEMP